MDQQIKVTVIIPVYNDEKNIQRCIESLISQSFKEYEALVINDGSKDKTLDILNDCVAGDKRFKVVTKENGGQSSARNLGLELARGQYITFVDSDDYVEKDFLEVMYENIDRHKADIAVCDVRYVDEDYKTIRVNRNGVEDYYSKSDYLLSQYTISNFVWDKIYKKELFNEVRFNEDLRSNEDVYLLFDLLYGKKIIGVSSPLYNYYQRPASVSRSIGYDFIKDRFKIQNKHDRFVTESSFIKDARYIDYSYIATFVFSTALTISLFSNEFYKDVGYLQSKIDKSRFTFVKIIKSYRYRKKMTISMLLYKISPTLFRFATRLWYKNVTIRVRNG